LLDKALGLLARAADDLASLLLYFTGGIFNSAFDLIFIHEKYPFEDEKERMRRLQRRVCTLHNLSADKKFGTYVPQRTDIPEVQTDHEFLQHL
jgi:hypothetical protein